MRLTILLPALLAFASLLAALPTHAAPSPFVATVQSGDPDAGQALASSRVLLSFFDANGNTKPDVVRPQEPVYLDIDGNGAVGYGDVRMTRFGALPAGTVVDVAEPDLGLPLASAGWFGRDGDAWYADINGDKAVSAGDIALASLTQVLPGNATLGRPLTPHDAQGQQRDSMWWVAQGNRYTTGQPLYLGVGPYVSGARVASVGDLRLRPLGFAADLPQPAAPTTAAPSGPSASSAAVAPPPGPTASNAAAGGTSSVAQLPEQGASPALVALGILSVANLVGLAMLARRLTTKPKNPFK